MSQNNYRRLRKIGYIGKNTISLCVNNGKAPTEPKYLVKGLQRPIYANDEIVAEQLFESYARSMHETFVSQCHLFNKNYFIGENNDI